MEARGKDRKRKHKVSTSETAAGAKLGRTKGNEQEAEYLESEAKHGKPGGAEEETPGSESGKVSTEIAAVRRRSGRKGKEETEAE